MKTTMHPKKLRLAPVLGMDQDARQALSRLEVLARSGKTAVAGRFMPDPGVSRHLATLGVAEEVEEADFFRFSRIVIPYAGIAPRHHKRWTRANVPLSDLSSPQVRRAQVSLGILRMEGARLLVIGRHADPETIALAESHPGTAVLEDTTDTARLEFAPEFGAVCQTTLSPRRVSWIAEQLRHRYRDARVTFLDTTSPSMSAREQALEKAAGEHDHVIIVGQPGEASTDALAEAALRQGNLSTVVSSAEELPAFSAHHRVILTAGAFATDATIRAVAVALARR